MSSFNATSRTGRSLRIEHPAEEQVFLALCGHLERVLTEPFSSDYPELLQAARQRLGAEG